MPRAPWGLSLRSFCQQRPRRDLLAGLERLRLPATLVAILSFMVRYLSVVSDDLQRMRIARESRGYSGGRVGQLRRRPGEWGLRSELRAG